MTATDTTTTVRLDAADLAAAAAAADAAKTPAPAADTKGTTKTRQRPAAATLDVYGGPAATVDPKTGRVRPIRPAAYPELVDEGELWCYEHKTTHPAKSFGLIGTKGSGKGRGLVCRKARDARYRANKALRAEGKPELPAYTAPASAVAPKPKTEPKAEPKADAKKTPATKK